MVTELDDWPSTVKDTNTALARDQAGVHCDLEPEFS